MDERRSSVVSETSQDIVDTSNLISGTGGTGSTDTDTPVYLIVGNEPVVIPPSVLKSSAFQNSHLSPLLTGVTPRGEKLQRNEKGHVIIPHPNPNAFKRVLAHLSNQRPLENASLKDMSAQYEELLAELIHLRLPRKNLNLPVRLWTRQSWTDLSAFYAMDTDTENLLYKRPVAVQLSEGEFPTPIHTAERLTEAEADEFYSKWETLRQRGHELYKLSDVFVAVASVDDPRRSVCGIYSPQFLDGRVLLYNLPHQFIAPAAPNANSRDRPQPYPYLVRKEEVLTVWFTPTFGLEVTAVCGRGRVVSVSVARQATQGSWLYASSGGKDDAKRADWCCYHPELSPTVKYNGQTRILRDMTLSQLDVRCVRFYQWGALMVSNKLDPVLAVIAIDDPDLARIYGPGISIVIRGTSYPALNRDDVDVTVAGDLSRVYLLLNGQLSSQPVTPMGTTSAKIVFEIFQASSGKAPRTKLAHCDIPDGGPTGREILGELNCLGVLADFDPATDLYRQAAISRTLCTRFVKLAQ